MRISCFALHSAIANISTQHTEPPELLVFNTTQHAPTIDRISSNAVVFPDCGIPVVRQTHRQQHANHRNGRSRSHGYVEGKKRRQHRDETRNTQTHTHTQMWTKDASDAHSTTTENDLNVQRSRDDGKIHAHSVRVRIVCGFRMWTVRTHTGDGYDATRRAATISREN